MGRKLLLPSAGTFFLHLFTLCRIPFIAIWQKGYYEVQMSVFCKRLLFEFQTMILEPLVLNARGYVLTLNKSLQYASWKIVICPFNMTVSRNNKYKSSKVKFTCDWRLFINSSIPHPITIHRKDWFLVRTSNLIGKKKILAITGFRTLKPGKQRKKDQRSRRQNSSWASAGNWPA